MQQSLSEKLARAFSVFKNKGKLSEADIKEGMRQIKLALLEADVNFKVVKEFINSVSQRAVGTEVMESLVPSQMIVNIVNEELTALMGGQAEKVKFSSKPPTVIMLVGLQGAGKTTHCAKLAKFFKDKNEKRPLLVACDVYRPAAIKQLQVVGESVGVPVFTMGDKLSPVDIAKAGINHAVKYGNDVVIIDTAGRLHIDETLMEELQKIKAAVEPDEILLTIDAMLGQDAVNVAKTFNEMLDITGVILTKLDGDTRGGAALSVKYVTGKPIKFCGIGEKMDALEIFHPDRMAQRILGMGDVLTLIEKAESAIDAKKAEEMERKLAENSFTLADYLDQLDQLKNMGPIENVLKMIPGANSAALKDIQIDDRAIDRTKAIIQSMTPKERNKPAIINSSRKKRIAAGCGMKVEDVNRLLKQYEQTHKLMKQFSRDGGKKLSRRFGIR